MCSGVILSTVQFSGLFNDSKTFVDMPLKRNPQCIIDDFNRMKDYSQKRSDDDTGRTAERSQP